MNHTPTPWHRMATSPQRIESESGSDKVAQCTSAANAAFIVRACNAHDELVAALTALLRIQSPSMQNVTEMQAARAVLAKVAA